MPCTFSHPPAVAPLSRLCPARLNLAGLVIGIMTPDIYEDPIPPRSAPETNPPHWPPRADRPRGVPSFPSAELLVFWGGQQAGFDAFSHNPVDYAASVECPTLFLHGTEDPRARVDEARQVFEAIAGPKHFQSFPQLGHESALRHHPGDWHRAITPFLRTFE